MAKIGPLQSPVAAAIEKYYAYRQENRDDAILRCSKIGTECDAALWFDLHWASQRKPHTGRQERLFETGRREEGRLIQDLIDIGCLVEEVDPATGKQWAVSFLGGRLAGSCDGKIKGVPGAENTEHLLEIKTMNDKNFQEWRRKGTREAKPVYFAQVQVYMLGLNLTRALIIVHNKNNDEIECERIKFDPEYAQAVIDRAERIAKSPSVPPKLESYACKFCRHETLCRYDGWPRMNCRTCISATLGDDAKWRCEFYGNEVIPLEAQAKGCGSHIFIPALIPGEQIDANESERTVTYSLRVPHGESDTYVDGPQEKIIIGEMAE